MNDEIGIISAISEEAMPMAHRRHAVWATEGHWM
jgi:hypothetical protein